jgi:hypothetical protein
MARGIFHATMINTVSAAYSREILGREGGCALDGLLRHRHFDVHGILNGLDYEVWNPATDRHLAATFDAGSLDRRLPNKRALQARVGLPECDLPLMAMVTRLDKQKGLDITGHVLHLLMTGYAGEVQGLILGAGWSEYEGMLRHLSGYHHRKLKAIIGYDAQLAPLIYGGSDILLMPSLFEPCGLGQLIAMHYGAVPVVGPPAALPTPCVPARPASVSRVSTRKTSGTPFRKRFTFCGWTPKGGEPSRPEECPAITPGRPPPALISKSTNGQSLVSGAVKPGRYGSWIERSLHVELHSAGCRPRPCAHRFATSRAHSHSAIRYEFARESTYPSL